jgi:hypothetical protein
MNAAGSPFAERKAVVKRKKRKRATKRVGEARPKMSEVVMKFAGDFISMGDTLEQKQSLLNAACSAWNIACNPPEAHEAGIDQYMESYRAHNCGVDEEHQSHVRSNLSQLIESKLRHFPVFRKPIVGAHISHVNGRDHIEVASVRLE